MPKSSDRCQIGPRSDPVSVILLVHLHAITALQINIIPLLVTMNRKIKKPTVKVSFWWS